MSKKTTIIVMACLFFAGTVYAGGSSSTSSGNGPVTISFVNILMMDLVDNSPTELWLEEKFNVKFDIIRIPSANLTQQLGLMLATGQFPDAIRGWSLDDLVKQDALGELDKEKIKKYAPDYYKNIEAINAEFGVDGWGMYSRDGKLYGLPRSYLNALTVGYGTEWRLDLMESVGFTEPPKTIAETEALFAAFKAKYPDAYCLGGPGGEAYYQALVSVYNAYGYRPGMYIYKDGRIQYAAIMPETRQALAKLAEWYKKGYIDPEYLTDTGSDVRKKFITGKLLTLESGHISYFATGSGRSYNETLAAEAGITGEKFDFSPSLSLNDTYRFSGSLPYSESTQFSRAFVKDEAKFAKYFEIYDTVNSDKETFLRLYWGEQGVRWDYDQSGFPQLLNESYRTPPEVARYGNLSSGIPIQFLEGYSRSRTFKDFYYLPADDIAAKPWVDKYTPKTEIYFNAAILPVPDSVRSTFRTNIDEMYRPVFDSIIMGNADISAWDQFVKDYLAAGGQAFLDATNEINLKFHQGR